MAGADARWTLRYGFRQALLLLLEVAGDPDDVLVGTGVTLLSNLLPDSCSVATALLPAPQDVVLVGRKGALTFFVKCRLCGGVSKARYFSTVWRCILRVRAIRAFLMPFFESAWMDRKSSRVCSLVRSFEASRSGRRFVSLDGDGPSGAGRGPEPRRAA